MSAPFILTGAARQTCIEELLRMSEPEAILWLARLRWGGYGENVQACPHCGDIDNHYWLKKHQRWKCKAKLCGRQFSVTSQTKFQYTQLTARELIAFMFDFQEALEGISARQLSGRHGMAYQKAHVLTMKMREALIETQDTSPLTGAVEADAAYFFKYRRPPNKGTGPSFGMKDKAKAAGLDEAAPKEDNRMWALVVFVERGLEGEGGTRVRVDVLKTEEQVQLLELAKAYVDKDAEVFTDEHSGYNLLGARFRKHTRVHHKTRFVAPGRVHTNLAEGFFAQMRRGQSGQWHRMGLGHLIEYGVEMAWRYEMRRKSNLVRLEDLTRRCLQSGPPKQYVDYWNSRPVEKRVAKPEGKVIGFSIPQGAFKRGRGRPHKATGTSPEKVTHPAETRTGAKAAPHPGKSD